MLAISKSHHELIELNGSKGAFELVEDSENTGRDARGSQDRRGRGVHGAANRSVIRGLSGHGGRPLGQDSQGPHRRFLPVGYLHP